VPKSVSVSEVKAHLAAWVRTAAMGETVVVTRHGKPVVALVAVKESQQLACLEAAGPEQGLASLAGGWEGSEELVERIMELRRFQTRRTPRIR
jgi:prevent-host-death family protein